MKTAKQTGRRLMADKPSAGGPPFPLFEVQGD